MTFLSNHRIYAFLVLTSAIIISLFVRGDLFVSIGMWYLFFTVLLVGALIWIFGYFFNRSTYRILGVRIVIFSLLQILLLLPLGGIVNYWDVSRARSWCEVNTENLMDLSEGERTIWLNEHSKPTLAEFSGSTCIQYERNSMMRWFVYDLSSKQWLEED